MGLRAVRRKHANIDQMRFAASLILVSAIGPRLINPVRFDKIKSPERKKPGHNGRAFDFRKPDFEKRCCGYDAAAGLNFATMPSSGLKVSLARSVYMPAIFCDSATKAS